MANGRSSFTATLILAVGLAASCTTATAATNDPELYADSTVTVCTYTTVALAPGVSIVIERRAAPPVLAIDLKDVKVAPSPQSLAPLRDNRHGAMILEGAPARMAWPIAAWSPRETRYVHPLRVDLGARSLV